MRKENLMHKTISILLGLAFVLCVSIYNQTLSFADTGKDYVIVIDVSTSMQDIFDEVKQVSKDTIEKARTGDNVAVITFGEHARLMDRKQIRGRADVENLKNQVDELYPTDYVTYINRGMEKGLSELRYLFEKYPYRERVLLWLSDDKDNPPKELGQDFITLEGIREQTKGFEPGQEWFAYNAPLSEVKNENLVDFVTWARRTTFRVAVREETVNLGRFKDGDINKKVALTFEPRHPGAAGLEFTASANMVDPNDPSRRIPVNISPTRITSSGDEWKQEFQVAFKGEPGKYTGTLVFRPIVGSALDVEPRTIPLTAMIVPPKLPEDDMVAASMEVVPTGMLADEQRRGIIATEDRPPGLTRPEKPLGFGGLEPGKKVSKIITLYLDKEADPKSITHDASIDVPEGVHIDSKVFGKGTKLAAEITVSVDKDIELPQTFSLQGAHEGSIRFVSSEPGVQVLPVYLPISVKFNTGRGVRWGRQMLAQATKVDAPKARRMTFEELTKELEKGTEPEEEGPIMSAVRKGVSTITSRYVLFPLLGILLVIIIIVLYRMRPASEVFTGELVVIKDPTNSNMKNINLKRVGSLHDKNILTVGTSPKADIRLSHDSVSPIHCKISAKTSEQHTDIAIQPMKGYPIKINDIEQTETIRLSDKDLIGIGDFILLFSRPEAKKEVVAHFLDGNTVKGTPVTWDIGSSSFELFRSDISESDEAAEEISVVEFETLKAVFFLKGVGGGPEIEAEQINREDIIEVTFNDGEKIEGYPPTDYSDVSKRFFVVPLEMPNISSILVERASVKEVAIHKAPHEAKEDKAGGRLAPFRRGKSPAAE
jgi:pSer/pThr/pTyr-binding forkhead associated (FHA) protein